MTHSVDENTDNVYLFGLPTVPNRISTIINNSGTPSSYPQSLPAINFDLYTDPRFCDISFEVGEVKHIFNAHRAVLATRSVVFQEMLFGPVPAPSLICFPGIQPATFQLTMRHIYTDDTSGLNDENALEVLRVAHNFKLDSLRLQSLQAASRAVVDTGSNIEKVIACMTTAQEFSEEILLTICYDLIDTSSAAFFAYDNIGKVPKSCLEAIIMRDGLTCSENEVYRGIERWAKSQCVENFVYPTPEIQRKFLGDLFFQIRFPLMSPKEISDGAMLDKLLTVDEAATILLYKFNVDGVDIKFPTFPRGLNRDRNINTETIRRENGELVPDVSSEQLNLILAGCTLGCECRCNDEDSEQSVKCPTRRKLEAQRRDDSVAKCGICDDRPKEITFAPCGHLFACATCASDPSFASECPVCRQAITEKIRTYIC